MAHGTSGVLAWRYLGTGYNHTYLPSPTTQSLLSLLDKKKKIRSVEEERQVSGNTLDKVNVMLTMPGIQ